MGRFEVNLGGSVRYGEALATDSMLFPASMPMTERGELIQRILDEVVEEEQEAGAE